MQSIKKKGVRVGLIAIILVLLHSCNMKHNSLSVDSLSQKDTVPSDFIADYDIAMTVRSIVDAISVGEPLDTAEYNYEGVLTDGQGTPLYTDIQGSPGEWEIDVTGKSSIRIRNVYLGDLMPEYLSEYITESLQLDTADEIDTDEYADDEETSLAVYDFGSGNIRFETRKAYAPNGLEGPLVSIILSGSDSKKE